MMLSPSVVLPVEILPDVIDRVELTPIGLTLKTATRKKARKSASPDTPPAFRSTSTPSPSHGAASAPDDPAAGETPVDESRAKTVDLIAMTAVVALPFLGCIAAGVWLWRAGWLEWRYLVMLAVGAVLTEWGITVGFHRLLTHRSFETYRWVRAIWTWLGALAVQGSPLVWCAVHRKHHQVSDLPGDPHSPVLYGRGWWSAIRGFFYAHTGWLFSAHWSFPDLKRYVPDLLKDRLLVGVDRMYYIWVILSLALPTVVGGLWTLSWTGAFLGFLWGGLVRIFVVQHITFSINSLCHMFGRREYQSGDDSRNNLLCGLLAQGEGWHNNHHAFPTSARHGLKWWQIDTSWWVICAMRRLHLAWNIQLPSPDSLARKRLPPRRR